MHPLRSLILILCLVMALACSGTSTSSNSGGTGNDSTDGSGTGSDNGDAGSGGGNSGGSTSRGLSTPAADNVTHSGSLPNSTGWFNATLAISGRSTEGGEQISVYRPSTASNLPLVLFFPGTGDNVSAMKDALGGESGIQSALASEAAVFMMLPRAQQSSGDWDHEFDGYFWNTTTDDSNTNPDLLLVRAVIQKARDQYSINASRVYLMGHSSGGFFAEFAAMMLKDRIAAFAENAAGYVRCFPSSGRKADVQPAFGSTSCSTILGAAGSALTCNSGFTEPFPASSLPASASQRVPAYLRHEISDTVVSVYNSCFLSTTLTAAGYVEGSNLSTHILNDGSGHSADSAFLSSAWNFLRRFTL